MLVVETIAKIRRAFFQDKKPIKQICRELRVSRKTVRKVIRSGATEFTYERSSQPQPRIGPWRDRLDALLEENARQPKRERLTYIRIFEELRALGYEGGYDAVRRYAAGWSKAENEASAKAYIPLSFDPGEAYQFDWSHEIVVIDGVTTTVKVAHVRLCHSRMMVVRAYPRETQEMVFDAHDKAFAFFGGACARGIYDNMKTAVDTIFVGKDRAYNRRFEQMCGHYLVEPVACTPASGWEKGQVENQVGVVRRRFFVPRPRFKSYAELNAWLMDRCIAWAKAHPHPELRDKTIWEVFEEERPSLVAYVGPFDGFHAVPASVSKTCLVRFDTNRYSVDARAVGRPVEIRAYAERVEFWQDGKIVGAHPRAFGRGKTIYDPLHYIPVLARKPGALRNGAPFKEWDLPPALRRVQSKLGRVPNGDRQVVEILGSVLTDGLEAVEGACAEALAEGVHSAGVILNILARHREPPPALTIATPDSLRLACEPTADCARYDSLRRPDHGKIARAGRDGPAQALRHEGGLRRDHGHRREAEARAAEDRR
jgi:transposase